MTTAKRRPVRWRASDSSVSRKCCGRRKQGMQTTVAIEVSSEGDAATHARAASGIAVANADTPNKAVVPKTSSGPASAGLTAQIMPGMRL